MSLEPCAVRLRWTFPQKRDGAAWSETLASYVETVAERCHEAGPCVVGHIKGFAPMPGGYLRINVTAPGVPADVEVHCSEPCAELILTLNVLVYGLRAETLASLAVRTATEVALAYMGTATLLEPEQGVGKG